MDGKTEVMTVIDYNLEGAWILQRGPGTDLYTGRVQTRSWPSAVIEFGDHGRVRNGQSQSPLVIFGSGRCHQTGFPLHSDHRQFAKKMEREH
jgi:hypothetical protein